MRKSDEKPKNKNTRTDKYAEFDIDSIETPSLAGHVWIQMGFQLICHSCTREHAVFLKPGFMYQGNDEGGKPIIKKIW